MASHAAQGEVWQFRVQFILMLVMVIIMLMKKGENDRCPQFFNFIFISILHQSGPHRRTSTNASFNVVSFVSSKLELFTFAPLMCHQQCPVFDHVNQQKPPPRSRRFIPKIHTDPEHLGLLEQTMVFTEKVLPWLHNTLQIQNKNRY